VTRHVGAETLARYRQEDLSRRRASRIRAHLAGCKRCRVLDEDLAGVTAMLADVQPPPIPEHLAARIQTALAAEAARRVAPTAEGTRTAAADARTASDGIETRPAGSAARDARPASGPVPGGRAPQHERPRRGRGQPWLPRLSSPVALRTMAAAAAVVVLAGGGYEIAQHTGGSSTSGTSTSAPAARQPLLGRNSSAAGSGTAGLPPYLRAGRQDVPVIASGTNYTPAKLKVEVRSTLTRFRAQALAGSPAPRSPVSEGNSSPTSGNSALAGCVTRIAHGQQVLLVDVASYQGTQATVVVTGGPAGGPEQAWVVGTGCSRASSDLLAHVTLAAAG
jgi:hypothetical protein